MYSSGLKGWTQCIKIVIPHMRKKLNYYLNAQNNSKFILDWILTVETLLDKLQLVEWNSLTKLHKRGQNPHGESHHWASSCNETGLLNQSRCFYCLNHSSDPAQSTQDHMPTTVLYFMRLICFYHSISLFLLLPFIPHPLPQDPRCPHTPHSYTHLSSPALAGVCFM